jgi:hypothetical protein
MTYIETTLVQQHVVLLSKYANVKRYYFEREVRLTQLQKEIEALKTNNPDAWSSALVESEEEKTASVVASLKVARELNANLAQEIERLTKERDWYRLGLIR